MNQDFLDFLQAFLEANVEFLVVGAHALAAHGVPRATGDLDVWIQPTPENARRIMEALDVFGVPVAALGVTAGDFELPAKVIQLGLPPRRIDILTQVDGLDFETAWTRRVHHRLGDLEVPIIAREDLIKNKQSTGRLKDLADVELLEGSSE